MALRSYKEKVICRTVCQYKMYIIEAVFKFSKFLETSIYLLGESVSGTFTSFPQQNGHGHYEILFPLRPRPIRFLLW